MTDVYDTFQLNERKKCKQIKMWKVQLMRTMEHFKHSENFLNCPAANHIHSVHL